MTASYESLNFCRSRSLTVSPASDPTPACETLPSGVITTEHGVPTAAREGETLPPYPPLQIPPAPTPPAARAKFRGYSELINYMQTTPPTTTMGRANFDAQFLRQVLPPPFAFHRKEYLFIFKNKLYGFKPFATSTS